jgi:multiple sugar transport system substrate-binding protein
VPSTSFSQSLSRRFLFRAAIGVVPLAGVGLLAACGGGAATGALVATTTAVPTARSTVAGPAVTTVASTASTANSVGATPAVTATGAATSRPPTTAAQSSPTKAAGKIIIGAKNEKGVLDYVHQQIAGFEQRNPSVPVEVFDLFSGGPAGEWPVRLKTMFVGDPAGTPDVFAFEVTQAVNLYPLSALQPLDGLIKADKTFKLTDLVDATVKVFQYQGRQMGIPNRTDIKLFTVNKTLLQNHGVAMPGNDWTVDQLLDAARKVTTATATTPGSWGFGGVVYNLGAPLPFWWLFGATLVDDARQKVFFDSPEVIAALQWAVDAAQKYRVTWPPSSPPKPAPSFVQGDLMVDEMNSQGYGEVRQTLQQSGGAKFEWDILPIPKGPKGQATVVTAEGYMIRQGTKQQDNAWDLVKYLMTPGPQQAFFDELSVWPARKDLFGLPGFRSPQAPPLNVPGVLDVSLPIARTYPLTPDYSSWMGLTTKAFNDAVDGKMSAADAAKQLQTSAQQALSTINQRFPS